MVPALTPAPELHPLSYSRVFVVISFTSITIIILSRFRLTVRIWSQFENSMEWNSDAGNFI